MSDDPGRFREELVALEQTGGAAREQYERQVKAMLEPTLRPMQRWGLGVGGLLCLACVAFMALLQVYKSDDMLPFTRAVNWLGCAGLLTSAIFCFSILIRGEYRRDSHGRFAMALGGIQGACLGAIFIRGGFETADPLTRSMLITAGFVLFGIVGVAAIIYYLQAHQLETRQRFLELEYRLSELGETLKR